jgi:hypothetical protein
MKVLLIGGSTQKRGTPQFDDELSVIRSTCHALGKELASRGHGLVLCSPFRDSADFYAAIGAADGQDPTLEFHYPDIAIVKDELKQLLTDIPNARVVRMPCVPLGDKAMQYSWLFSQLNALDASAGVIAIGGKPTGAAQFLFRLAAAKNKSILPLTFLGGSAADYFDNKQWDLRDVLGRDLDLVSNKSQIQRIPDLLEQLLAGVTSRDEHRFFISYARARPKEADYIETLLRRRNAVVYRDEEDFEPAAETQEEIIKNIKRSNVFVAIWCKEYACSPWCFDELELAIERHKRGLSELWIFCVDETRIVPRDARTLIYYNVNTREAIEGKILHLMNRLQNGRSS